MKTNLLKVVSAVALASTLVACGKTKTVKEEWTDEEKVAWAEENGYEQWTDAERAEWAEENGYVRPVAQKALLEVTFNNYKDDAATTTEDEQTRNLTSISYTDLYTKFEGDYDFLLMLGNSTCGTCSTLKSYLADWVAETHYSVYYISDLTDTTDVKYTDVWAKLSNPTSWPRLYAVIGGEVRDVLTFQDSNDVTETKVNGFIEEYFEMEEFKAETYRFENMAEYRAAVASGEQFIVYVGRDACPDCKNLSDIKKDDSLRKYFKEYDGKIYSIISEDTIAEHKNSTLWNDVTKWSGYWGSINVATQTSSVSGNNKAENLAYMIAGGVFDAATLALGQEAFLQAALDYANDAYLNDDGTKYMRDSIRSVPGLAAVNFAHSVQYATENDSVFALIADNAEMGTRVVGEGQNAVTYKTVRQTKTIQVYNTATSAWENQEVTYNRFAVKALALGGSASTFTGDNPVALWIAHKNAFVGALGGKGAATMSTYTNNLTFSNIYTDCLTSRNATYHTEYEVDFVQAQTMNWMNSWVYNTAA